jgi:hypothetical protein
VTQLQDTLSAVTQLTYDNNNNVTQMTAPSSGGQNVAASSYLSYHAAGQKPPAVLVDRAAVDHQLER